jgi:hypothetical protein
MIITGCLASRSVIPFSSDGQARFPALPRDRHPSSGHPLPDMPPRPRLPARESQRCPDRALPPGPARNTRPPLLPVASRTQIARRPQGPLPVTGQPARQDRPTDPSRSQPTERAPAASAPARRGAFVRRSTGLCTPGRPGAPDQLQAMPGNIRICRCDTRSHLASELADWRADYVGRVVTGACSRPGPALSCAAGNGGVRSTGESPRASRPIRGATGEGQTGGVNRVNPR